MAVGVPLEHEPIVADHEDGSGLTFPQNPPGHFERSGVHPLALGGCVVQSRAAPGGESADSTAAVITNQTQAPTDAMCVRPTLSVS